MSWASHDVEGWDEVERNAVTARLKRALVDCGFEGLDTDTIEAVVFALQQEANEGNPIGRPNSPWAGLVDWSLKELSHAEADYFSGKVSE